MAQESGIRKSRGGHIVTIDVAPEFRRHGFGRLLMQQIENRMGSDGAGWLRLEVAVNNSDALNFYAGLGFKRIGQIPNYYQESVDAIVMEKALADAQAMIP